MARKKSETPERESFFSSLDGSTVRGVIGVALVVTAVILVLAALGLAGPAGTHVHSALTYLFGAGFFVLPLGLVGYALSLFLVEEGTRVSGVRLVGAALFLVSAFAIVEVLSRGSGGVMGMALAWPALALFDIYAGTVILVGILLTSLLLLFETKLFTKLYASVYALTRRNKKGHEMPEDDVVEVTEVVDTDIPEEDEEHEEEEVEESEPEAETPTEAEEEPGGFGQLFGGKKTVAYVPEATYTPPPLSLLDKGTSKPRVGDTKANVNIIKRTLQNFGIRVEMDEVTVGPSVTRYALKPAEGVRLAKIVNLQSNLELALAASPIRIEAPIPGKALVGIEVPNSSKATVGLGPLLADPSCANSEKNLLVTLGKDISGNAHFADISKMPHALIAGATGSGKSVTIHAFITSLLYRNGPEKLRLILVDPKRVELTLYNNIPHLLTPVIIDAKKAIIALKWAAKEMDRRYDILQEKKVRDLASYDKTILEPARAERAKLEKKGDVPEDYEMPEPLPHIVIVIDELADIMQAYPRELESAIVRLAQMSRAVGIHLLLSTQRPSVNVITGLIKANIPTRVALQVSSQIDSRTILDTPGAEKLLGAGDMLYLSGEMAKPRRIQSPFITEEEVKKVVAFLAKHNDDYAPDAKLDFSGAPESSEKSGFIDLEGDPTEEGGDELYEEARRTVIEAGKASTSYLQRKLSIGYGRAAKLMDLLEERGVIGPQNGSKPRDIIDDNESGDYVEDEEADDERAQH